MELYVLEAIYVHNIWQISLFAEPCFLVVSSPDARSFPRAGELSCAWERASV